MTECETAMQRVIAADKRAVAAIAAVDGVNAAAGRHAREAEARAEAVSDAVGYRQIDARAARRAAREARLAYDSIEGHSTRAHGKHWRIIGLLRDVGRAAEAGAAEEARLAATRSEAAAAAAKRSVRPARNAARRTARYNAECAVAAVLAGAAQARERCKS